MAAGGSSTSLSASSSSTSNYESLLRTIGELQSDLHACVAVCDTLKHDNDSLRGQYAQLKSEFLHLKAQYDAARGAAMTEAEARIAAERQHEALVVEVTQALESREREMEDLVCKMAPPRDLSQLRIQIGEEMQAAHAGRTAQLESEVDKHKAAAVALKRELEVLRAEYDAFARDQAAEADSTFADHAANVGELQRVIAGLQARVDEGDCAALATIRSLRASVDDSSGRARSLAAEVESVTRERDELRSKYDILQLSHTREMGDAVSRLRLLEGEAAAAGRARAAAEAEAAQTSAANASLTARASALAIEVQRLQTAATASERAHADEIHAYAARAADARQSAERDVAEMRSKLEDMQSRAIAAESAAARAVAAESHASASAAARIAELERRLADAEERAHAAEARSNAAEDAARAVQARIRTFSRRSSVTGAAPPLALTNVHDVDDALDELTSSHMELHTLRARAAAQEGELAALREAAAGARAAVTEATNRANAAERAVRELSAKQRAADSERAQLQDSVRALEHDLTQLRARADDERRTLTDDLERVKSAAETITVHLTKKKNAYKAAVVSARSKASAYKDKLLELYRMYQDLKQALQESEATRNMVSASRDAEVSAAMRTVKDLLRDKEMTAVRAGDLHLPMPLSPMPVTHTSTTASVL